MLDEFSGSCLCGKVRFAVAGPVERFRLCHCSRCRKATGAAHGAFVFVPPEGFRWVAGEELVKEFKLPTAEFFARAFCVECGSPVPRISRRDGRVVIPAGLLDEDPGMLPQDRIYCADEPAWARELETLPRHDGPPG